MGNLQFAQDIQKIPGYAAVIPTIISQSNVASYTGDAETIAVTGSRIVVPQGFFGPGATFRFTMAGSRTGTAGAATIYIYINATSAISLAVPTNTAVDWTATFLISEHTNMANQNCFGIVHASATVLSISDYAAATVDVSAESTIQAKLVLANGSDEVTCNYVLVEYWKV